MPATPPPSVPLERILKGVSRSFYLTLRVAPGAVRRQLGVAYLFCRAADTIADTPLLPADRRLELLSLYRSEFEQAEPTGQAARSVAALLASAGSTSRPAQPGPAVPSRTEGLSRAEGQSSAERLLLQGLERCFVAYRAFESGDRALIRRLVTTLTLGMEMDLLSFPLALEDPPGAREAAPEPAALPDDAALDRYCYHVAGCVGEFWTDLAASRLPALSRWDLPRMRAQGVRFGKGLQMTNVLRDLPRDLRLGRSYVPRTRLRAAGLDPGALRGGGRPGAPLPEALGPILDDLLDLTLEHYRAGWEYTLAIPARAPRLRLACAWPLLIGLRTLALLRARRREHLQGALLKITRGEVLGLLARSSLLAFHGGRLDRLYRRLEAGAARPTQSTVNSRQSTES